MPACSISITDLSAAGLRLNAAEAVAVARDVATRAHHGSLPGIPTVDVLRFSSDGAIVIEGPVAAGRSVERAGRLLDALLAGFDAPPELRAPGGLRLVVARALGTLDLPRYQSLQDFSDALARFSAPDCAGVVRGLCQAWSAAAVHQGGSGERESSPETDDTGLTISDVRRARRATGLTLTDVSQRSRIPVSLLRELEWGYFVNWPGDSYGRTQLLRYARAAGLDERVVVRAVWPVLDEAVRSRAASARVVDATVVAEAPVVTESLVRIEPALTPAHRRPRRLPRHRTLAAVAVAGLVAVGLAPALWNAVDDEDRDGTSAAATAGPPAAEPAVQRRPDVRSASPEARVNRPSRPAATSTPPATAAPALAVAGREPEPAVRAAALPLDTSFSPGFASTGSAMFYHSAATGSSAIMRADTDGAGGVLRVTSVVNDNALNFHARPSPDGESIAFDSDRDGERAVYVADADGRGVRRVTGEGFAAVPSWSPDGRQLAFVRSEPGRPRVWNLWTVDLETGSTSRLTSHPYGQPWGAAWFPDGTRIAYSHEDRLIVRSLDGKSQRIYPSPRKGQLLRTPAVSPDGRRVIFQVHKDGAWLLDLADGSMRRILTDPTAEEFTWSPDGRQVAYHSRKTGDWGIWVMTAR